jgi:hypothetical protein
MRRIFFYGTRIRFYGTPITRISTWVESLADLRPAAAIFVIRVPSLIRVIRVP